MPLAGNLLDDRASLRAGIEALFPGFMAFASYGVAAIPVAQAASATLLDADGIALSIAASAADPVYLAYCSLAIPAGIIADAATRSLKLAPLATTAVGATAAISSASGTTPFAYAAEAVRSASVPGTMVAVTAATTFGLFSVDNTGLVAAGTFGSSTGTLVYADCEILYLRRKPAIRGGDAMRSKFQAYVSAGVPAGYI